MRRWLKIGLGALAALLIGIGLFWNSPDPAEQDTPDYTVVDSRPVGGLTAPDSGSSQAAADTTPASNPTPAETTATDVAATAEPGNESTTDSATTTDDTPATTETAETSTAAADTESNDAQDDTPAQDNTESADANPPVDDTPLALDDTGGSSTSTASPTTNTPTSTLPDSTDAGADEPANDTSTATAAATGNSVAVANLESPNWILLQNPALFTVQMSASTDLETVQRFLAANELDGPNSIFTFERDGNTWHALVHGLFPSLEAAREAVNAMPQQALTNQPWIRQVGRVQQALKNP